MGETEDGMTYVEKLDFREQAHRHEMERVKAVEAEATKRAKYQHNTSRQDTIQIVGIAIVIGLVVCAIFAGVMYWNLSGPDDPGGLDKEERREIACVENGGGWVPDNLLAAGVGLCVYPGKTAR